MKRSLRILIILCLPLIGRAQSFTDSIAAFRKEYIKELLAEPRQPVKPADVRYLRFFAPNTDYRVWASFTEVHGAQPFLVPTHSGKQKPYKEYGILTFTIHDTLLTLHVYQSVDLVTDGHNTYLFLPFTDGTNYETTFAGGRYIDLSIEDLKDNKYLLDFNKCYNPYCAYADGFSCPIPPQENALHINIPAGEKMYVKQTGE